MKVKANGLETAILLIAKLKNVSRIQLKTSDNDNYFRNNQLGNKLLDYGQQLTT